jgi:hypothetical protein
MHPRRVDLQPSSCLVLKMRRHERQLVPTEQWVEHDFFGKVWTDRTAILLCDLWDTHWCSHAARQIDFLSQKIEQTLNVARAGGIQIIHSPSGTMSFYDNCTERRRAQNCPISTYWISPDRFDPPLSFDGMDFEHPSEYFSSKQNSNITIKSDDIISDDGIEIINFLSWKKITHLIYVGVHSNMCILERSFGIKQMVKWGIKCLLIRDLTDVFVAANQSAVARAEAAAITIKYIEQYWCPTTLNSDFLAAFGKPIDSDCSATRPAQQRDR